MTVNELLQTLETQPHTARVQTMIELGRRARNEEEMATLLSEMAQGEWYQRFLALYSCFGSLHTTQVLTALTDSSRIIRGLALRLLPLACNEAELQQTLENAPHALRQPLLWKLAKYGHQALIDRFVEQLSPDDPQYCKLVCFASETTLLQFAPLFESKAQLADWSRLARFQPGAVVERLIQWADQPGEDLKPTTQYINQLLPLLVRSRPERSLHLLNRVLRFIPLDKLELNALASRYPIEIIELVLAQKEPIHLEWKSLIPKLPAQYILDLCAKQKSASNYSYSWFPLLSLENRLFIYQNGRHFLRYSYQGSGDDTLARAILMAVPQTQRAEEARKAMSDLERTHQNIDLEYAALLPWDEVQATIAPYMHSSDAERRSQALFAQIGAVRYHKGHLSLVLEQLLQRRTEHDGVRKGILFALVALPVTFWQKEHLAHLEEIIRHGLNDVGLSQETLRAILKLLLLLLPAHFEWATQQLSVALRERGFTQPIPQTERDFATLKVPALQIEPGLRSELLTRLLPVLHIWAEQEKEAALLDVIAYFAPRGPLPEKISDLLATLLQQTQTGETAERALTLLARHEPQRFAETLFNLLQEDASWITRPIVSSYLLRFRQDLLTPFLMTRTYSGRFSTGRKRFLPPLTRNATCLTASQQTRYASVISGLIHEANRESRVAAQALATLAFLPAISPDTLVELARHKSSIIRTTALFTLGRLDGGDVIPELLAALQDSRARIAIIVLRPLLLRMPPPEALAILRTVPRTRVTVAKETIRLIGDLASEEAYRELLMLEQSELHRDVRVALVTTLWNYAHHAQTWTLMERVIQTPNSEIALAAVPDRLFMQYWRDDGFQFQQLITETGLTYHQHILRLASLLLQHPDKEIRFNILKRYTRSYRRIAATDREHILLPQLVQIIETGKKEESIKAAEALFNLCPPADSALISQVFRARLHRLDILDEMVDELEDLEKEDLLPLIRAALDVLATSSLTTLLRLNLADTHLPADELFPFYTDLAARGELHAEALSRACNHIDRDFDRFDIPTLEKLELQFASSDDERIRRLGLAILLEQAQREEWTVTYRNRLNQYRSDPSLMIATVAQFTFPTDDDDDFDEDDE